MTEPFDLDARIDEMYWDNPSLEEIRKAAKQLIRDAIQAVKPEKLGGHRDELKRMYAGGYDDCIDQLEANITNLLGDK